MRSRPLVVLAAVVLAAASAAILVPLLTENRDYPASIPSPAPLFAADSVEVPPAGEVCFRHAVAEQHSREARFRTLEQRAPGPPLRLELSGPGYAERRAIAGGYTGIRDHRVPIDPPGRPTPLRVCIENAGDVGVQLFAASDRTRSRSIAVVDGEPTEASVVFGFWETGVVDIRRRLPAIAERVGVMRPAFVGPWLFWILALLLVAGIPALALYALNAVLRDEAED